MPRITETFFVGCPISVEKERLPKLTGENGTDPENAELQDVWKLVIFDPHDGTRYCYRMDAELKDTVVKELTGGVVVAQDFRRMDIPKGRK